MLRTLSLSLVLYLFWITLSGFFTPFLLGAGLVSSILIAWICHRAGLVDFESHPIERLPHLLAYGVWLVKEIFWSGWSVSKIILSPSLPISPTLVRITPSQTTDFGRVIHANSITLTPGTITVETQGGEFLIHGITNDSATGCIDSEMNRRVSQLES
jgi:multicomponent Na+:H+ antiporter subunit E